MRTSYSIFNYNTLFKSMVAIQFPKLIIECGILDGYSLFSMAHAVKHRGLNCKIIGIDLFDDYEFKHGNKESIELKLKEESLNNVELRKQDALIAANDFENESIDILHIDISNDCDILSKMFDLWTPKIKKDGIVIFEGGSKERDNVEWMVKYNKNPIENFKKTLTSRGYEYVTITPYPSLTLCRKV